MGKTVRSIFVVLCGVGVVFGSLSSGYAAGEGYYPSSAIDPNMPAAMSAKAAPSVELDVYSLTFSSLEVRNLKPVYENGRPVGVSWERMPDEICVICYEVSIIGDNNEVFLVWTVGRDYDCYMFDKSGYVMLNGGDYRVKVVAVNNKGEVSKKSCVEIEI